MLRRFTIDVVQLAPKLLTALEFTSGLGLLASRFGDLIIQSLLVPKSDSIEKIGVTADTNYYFRHISLAGVSTSLTSSRKVASGCYSAVEV